MTKKAPILEFDEDRKAIIEPYMTSKPIDAPECCVFTFFYDVLAKIAQEYPFKRIAKQPSENGSHPLWEFEINGRRMAAFHPGVGAPLAAGMLEEIIARGCRKFVVCGSCGVLDSDIAMGHLIVPEAAIRDEGTSYHYLPAAREVRVQSHPLQVVKKTLESAGIPFVTSKTWTTDALYRETGHRMARRKAEGCLTVEMEAAALLAVAEFRNVELGYILYSGDDLAGEKWHSRKFVDAKNVREKLFWLAVEACLKL